MKNAVIISIAALLLLVGVADAGEVPSLKDVNGKAVLHVKGEPFIILGAQMMNSSSLSLEFMEKNYPKLKELNVNTVICPIVSKQVEPVEGEFDFSLVDGLIIRLAQDQFMIVGNGARVSFSSQVEGEPSVEVVAIEEGDIEDGKWVRKRLLCGDEARGKGARLPPVPYGRMQDPRKMSYQKIKLFRLPAKLFTDGQQPAGQKPEEENVFD